MLQKYSVNLLIVALTFLISLLYAGNPVVQEGSVHKPSEFGGLSYGSSLISDVSTQDEDSHTFVEDDFVKGDGTRGWRLLSKGGQVIIHGYSREVLSSSGKNYYQ